MRGENHALPVLREITLEDMVFVVVPRVESERRVTFYYQLHELLDEAVQLLEVCMLLSLTRHSGYPLTSCSQGLAFLHENLIAHLVGNPFSSYLKAVPVYGVTRI
jgi:hypothetical protein